MAITVNDLQALLHLLAEQPEWRTRLRDLLLGDDLDVWSERFERIARSLEQLAEAQRRTEAELERLAQAQRLSDELIKTLTARLDTLTERVDALTRAQERTQEQLTTLAARVEGLTARVDDLTARMEDLTARVNDLAVRMEDLTARVNDLTVRMEDLTARVTDLTVRMEDLTARVDALTTEVRNLVAWQRGEAGRREGERYEQLIIRRAPVLFNGGTGGSPAQPLVQQTLVEKLKALPALHTLIEAEDPFLADLIWWKDEHFLVVEVSVQVNGGDVDRAAWRAETLRRANVQATGMVIGREWADPDARNQAQARAVEWKVGDDLSQGLIAFRQLSA